MAYLSRASLLKRYNDAQSTLLDELGEKSYSAKSLKQISESFSYSTTYDIFLSHSYQDARIVRQVHTMLTDRGYSVYVDWIEDSDLNRARVTASSASRLRFRMNSCSSLLYLTSEAAGRSIWMPWELGFMDARTGRVAVAPILENERDDFHGREYLGIYPYLDLTSDRFYIHNAVDTNKWVDLEKWMSGKNP